MQLPYLLKKNLLVSRLTQFNPLSFKSRLYMQKFQVRQDMVYVRKKKKGRGGNLQVQLKERVAMEYPGKVG